MRAVLLVLGAVLVLVPSRPAASQDLPTDLIPPSAPSIFDRPSVRVALGLGAAALATAEFDDGGEMVAAFEGSALDTGLLDVADVYGSGTTLGAASLGLLAAGQLAGQPRMSALGKDLTRSLLSTWTAVWALKLSVGARRPNGGSHSFPSGHTATAFAAAPVLSRHLGTVAGITAYSVAGLTALARMEDGKHFPRDVLMGAANGQVMGDLLTSPGGGLQVSPGPDGLALSVHF